MPINFPLTPTLNQEYSFGGKTWKWNSTGWGLVGVSSIAASVSVTPAGNIASVNVQAALEELDTEKQGVMDFIASGAIASAGLVVALNVDGTVSVVAPTVNGANTPVVFSGGSIVAPSIAYGPAGKFVVAYRDTANLNRGTAVVGTLSGNSISFGTPVVFLANSTNDIGVAYAPNTDNFVIAYVDSGTTGAGAVVGTVSGTTISFGTNVKCETGTASYTRIVYDTTTGKVVIAYKANGNAGKGTAVVGTISGTAISYGAKAIFELGTADFVGMACGNGKVVALCRDVNNGNFGTAAVGIVSGTDISFGTPVLFRADPIWSPCAAYDANADKFVIAYSSHTNGQYGTAVVGTVSGTDMSFGTPVYFETATSSELSIAYNSALAKVVITYKDGGNNNFGTAAVGTVSGTAISFGTAVVFESAATSFPSIAYDNDSGKMVIAYMDVGNANNGTAVVWTTAGVLNHHRRVGVAQAPALDAAPVTVKVPYQIDTNQVGLTPGAIYYVTSGGALSLTKTSNYLLGRAISSTGLLITEWSVEGTDPPQTITHSKGGVMTVLAGVARVYPTRDITLSKWELWVGVAPTGADLIAVVNKNGTPVETLTLPAGTNYATGAATTSLLTTDYLTVDVTQIGSTIAGSDLSTRLTGN